MNDLNPNKNSLQNQDAQTKSSAQTICTQFAPTPINTSSTICHPFATHLPTPRRFEGKDYYGVADVAKIIGVTRQNVSWWHNQGLFIADVRTHDGRYLYEVERVMQLKSVYHKDWRRGGYQSSPTTTAAEPVVREEPAQPQNKILNAPFICEGKLYYGVSDVAKIIGVSKTTISNWNWDKLFTADLFTAEGRYLYEVERVLQLKSVYHRNWRRGGYQSSPTTTAAEPVKRKKPKTITIRKEPKTVVAAKEQQPALTVIKKRNVQVYPSKVIFFPNDRFSKKIATLTDDDFQEMNSGEGLNLVELNRHKKFGKILSPFRIFIDENSSITLSEPVEQFDFAVLCVAISEYYVGNRFITPGIIYRALTGKVNDNDANPSKVQLASILHSVEKLMFLKTQINMTDYCQKLNCNDGKAFEILSPLLPAKKISETTINGKESTIIELTSESPLWQIACLKNQLMSFDAALLNVPNQNNSKMNIELKNYVLRRIVEVKKHRQLTPTITFDDLFFKCRLENISRDKKSDARNAVIEFFEHLKKEKFIKDFEPVKHGNSFYSITFKK